MGFKKANSAFSSNSLTETSIRELLKRAHKKLLKTPVKLGKHNIFFEELLTKSLKEFIASAGPDNIKSLFDYEIKKVPLYR